MCFCLEFVIWKKDEGWPLNLCMGLIFLLFVTFVNLPCTEYNYCYHGQTVCSSYHPIKLNEGRAYSLGNREGLAGTLL